MISPVLTFALCFLAVPFATSDDATLSLLPADAVLSRRQELANPSILLPEAAEEGTNDAALLTLPNYCRAEDHSCYKHGVPLCCIRSSMGCQSKKPECDVQNTRGQRSRSTDTIPAGGTCRNAKVCKNGSCRRQDNCESGYFCSNNRCIARSITLGQRTTSTDVIPAGGTCRNAKVCKNGSCRALNNCESGYVCSNNRCSARSNRRRISPGGVCRFDDVCESGYFCSNGRCESSRSRSIRPGGVCQVGDDVCDSGYTCIGNICTLPLVPAGGVCRPGIDTCATGYLCIASKCHAPQWFASNGQYCVMDCLSTDSPCCGGSAQSWDEVYSSAEQCCGQTMFQGNYDGCLNKSLQCYGDEQKNKSPFVLVE